MAHETPIARRVDAVIAGSFAATLAALALGVCADRIPLLRDRPPIWSVTTLRSHLRFCGRDYRHPARTSEPLEPIDPVVDGIDGLPLRYPAIQTVIAPGGEEVCTTVLQIHDSRGWVTYELVGGP